MVFLSLFYSLLLRANLPGNNERPLRSVRIGITPGLYTQQTLNKFQQTPLGLYSRYDFHLTRRFTLGIQLNYRRFYTDQDSLGQMTYGLTMEHDIGSLGKTGWRWFTSYGLLSQRVSTTTEKSHVLAHNTQLALGCRSTRSHYSPFFEFSYHLSQAHYFSKKEIPLNHVGFAAGIVWALREA